MSYPSTRILALLELLQTYPGLTGAELADRLGVDPRTLRRYTERLIELGIPVTATRGRHGGYRLMPGYKLPPLMFTDAEAVAVTLGLLAARHIGLSTVESAADLALAKLRRVLPDAVRDQAGALEASLGFTLRATGSVSAAPSTPVLLTLSEAVAARRRVALTYTSWRGEDSRRELDPYGIVFHSGRWYVTGHDHRSGERRTFRLDRIATARLGEAEFDAPGDFDPVAQIIGSLAAVPYRWECEVVLETTLDEARAALPRAIGEFSSTGAGVLLRVRAEDLGGMARMLAGLGWAFTVRRPAELRAAVRELADRLSGYAGTD
ncbi:YafY family protein [Phytomonospora sp. NPDC050363]|uniref:helix-turn-helix transcriptional regulator n=1 Tax=Phytomonospora sp. NPDC050363 TaxID=3155642 RepID=UPI0033CD5EA5